MASKLVLSKGAAVGVYDDRWLPIYQALGALQVQRATSVEFDSERQVWVARLLATGEEIAAGPVRAEVIRAEVEYLERRLG